MVTPSIPQFGFGDYALPKGRTFEQMQLCERVQKAFFAVLYGALVAVSVAVIPVAMPLAVVGIGAFSYLLLKTVLEMVGTFYRAAPKQGLFTSGVQAALPKLGETALQPCRGFATRDGVESHEWKLNLIRSARHTIFLSGCYCGGSEFDETLDLIRDRLRAVPGLTTSILSSNIFITAENQRRLDALKGEFRDRFVCTVTPEVFPYTSPTTGTFSLSTNHTKALVIDCGAAFMIGGSGLVSAWSKQKGELAAEQIESHGLFYDHILKIKAYRDMDFVFQSPVNGAGGRVHVEMTKLLHRFTELPAPVSEWPAQVEPIAMPRQIGDLKIAAYATGPEQPTSAFIDDIVAMAARAERSIHIAHMYFHPTPKLLKALIDASNRGVKITLITNKLGSQSPGCHLGYAELSRYYAKLLFEGREKPNVEHYEYDVPYATFHKKVFIVDGKVTFNGSANIGYKSLVCADYEIDLKVESEPFAAATIQILDEDKKLCKIDRSPKISLKTRLFSTAQSLCTPFL